VHIPDRTRLVPVSLEYAASWQRVAVRVVAAAVAPAAAEVVADSCTRSVPWPRCVSFAIVQAHT